MAEDGHRRRSRYSRPVAGERPAGRDGVSGESGEHHTRGARKPRGYNRRKRGTWKRGTRKRGAGFKLFVAMLVALAVTASLVAVDYRTNSGTIHDGVEVSGISLGGKSRAEARTALEERFSGVPGEIRLEGSPEATIPAERIGLGLDARATVEEAYSVGREGDVLERIAGRLRSTTETIAVEPEADYGPERIRAEVERLASEIDQEPRNARISVAGGDVQVAESSPGYEVDVEATMENVSRAAEGLDGEARIAGESLEPAVDTGAAEEAAERTRAATRAPLVLEGEGESWSLSAAQVGEALDIARRGEELRVGLDRAALRERLPGMYDSLVSEPVEADYSFDNGEVTVQAGSAGRRIDQGQLFGAIEKGIFEGRHRYEVPLTRVGPELTTAEARRLKPTQMIGRYRTTYAGTGDESEARTENLRTAANAIDGTTLAPGETFSANEILADLDYNDANVIIDGKVESALGGGLCQIASTVYMAVNYAGLDVTERHPHHSELSYIRPGLDSTLWFGAENGYTGQELDMEFRNTSDGYVMVREYVDEDGYLYAEVWGQPTGAEVEMDSRQVSSSEEQTEWVTTQTVERGGETVFDGFLHRDTYEPLISEEGEPIPNADPAPVRQ